MAQARDEAGNIWEVDEAGNAIRLIQAAQAPQAQGVVMRNPTAANRERRADEDQQFEQQRLQYEQQRLAIAQQQAALDAQRTGAQIQKDAIGLQQAGSELQQSEQALGRKDIRSRLRYGNVLDAIKRSRSLAMKGGTGWDSLMAPVPESDARQLASALKPLLGALSFDRLNEMREESVTGGALGSITEKELDLLGSTVASLDTGISLNEFLRSLDQVERHFINSQIALSGIDPSSEEGAAFFSQYANPSIRDETAGMTPQQAQMYNAFLDANPNVTAEQLNQFTNAVGIGTIANADEVIAARARGSGFAPGEASMAAPQIQQPYDQSYLGQGMSGVNEGLATGLGFLPDTAATLMNLVPQGINAIANTNIPTIQDPFLGSQWWNDALTDAGTIYTPSADPSKQFVRRVGQSVGAAAIPFGGAATTGAATARQAGAGLLAGLGGGVGAATAQQVAPGNIGAEIAGELIGSFGVGLGVLGRQRATAQRAIEAQVPTVDDLKGQANQLYTQAEQRGITASPAQTTDLRDRLSQILLDEGQMGPAGPITSADTSTTKAINLIDQYAGQPMSPKQMKTVRGVLAEGRQSLDPTDQRLARILLNEFDDFTVPLAPEFADARAVASRYLSAQDLEKARELAGVRAGQFSGSGFENALRTEYRGLERDAVRGRKQFPDPVLEAIQDVSRGTDMSNIARGVGKLAPTGVVSGGLGAGVPFMIGNAVGGPVAGGLSSALTMGAGTVGRAAATKMGIRNAELAELIARNGGVIDRAPLMSKEDELMAALLLASQTANNSQQGY